MKKEIYYALIGGAALVGAALIFHYSKASSEADDTLDQDIA